MIYLVILFPMSLTSENHTLGLGKDVHASNPRHTGSWDRITWAIEFKTCLSNIIRPSLKEEGWWVGLLTRRIRLPILNVSRKKQNYNSNLEFNSTFGGVVKEKHKIVKALLELITSRFVKCWKLSLHLFISAHNPASCGFVFVFVFFKFRYAKC